MNPAETLAAELGRIHSAVPAAAQIAALVHFADELLRWNAKINLTAARTMNDALHHIADSSAVIRHIPSSSRRLVDVGSGGGLPAVVIALLRPELEITALEPVHKKHAFLQHARRALSLAHFEARAERVEQHAGRDYDVATSRATFALATWLETGRTLVRPGGLVLGMEGADLMELPSGASRHAYELGDRTRAIVSLAT